VSPWRRRWGWRLRPWGWQRQRQRGPCVLQDNPGRPCACLGLGLGNDHDNGHFLTEQEGAPTSRPTMTNKK
jgi:hypothetical protein